MSKVFFGGIPTSSDVRKLNEAFGVPAIGAEFTHDQVAEATGIAKEKNRYRTVVSAWRAQLLRDHNIDLGSVPGFGFRALDAGERISAGIKGVRQGVRKQLRAIRRADTARTDDALLQRKQDLLRRYGAALAADANKTMQQLEPPKPQPQQPRAIPSAATTNQ